MAQASWRTPMAIAALVAATLLLLTVTTTLWDRDESRFGQAAVEMVSSGNYLLPTFNGELRPQKPPLAYWLMTLSLRVFGRTEMAVRFWSPMAMAVAALATFVIGRRFWSADVGVVAMLALVSSPLSIVEGTAATADAILLAAITASVAIGSKALVERLTLRDTAAFTLALGIGALAKGPVAIVLPVLIIVVASAIARRHSIRTTITLAGAATAALVIFGLWFVPAALASQGDIATRGLVRENISRFLNVMEGHGASIWLSPFYYPAVIAIGFAPWIAHIPRTFREWARERDAAPGRALLIAWVVVPLAIFTLAATKLPHYALPVWPALALAVGKTLVDARQRAVMVAGRLAAGIAALTIALGLFAAPILERYKPVPPVMEVVRRSPVPGPVYAFGFSEPSLAFYGERPIVELSSGAAVHQWAGQPGDAVLVTSREAISAVEGKFGPLGLSELAASRGWNYVKGERLELVAFARSRDR